MSGMGGGGGGGGGGIGMPDLFSLGMLGGATQQADQAMTARYNQLGLSGNPQGGSPQSAAKAGTSLQPGGQPTTALSMDLGNTPSLAGGISGMEQAVLGQLENMALQSSGGGGGGGSSGGGGKGGGGGGGLGSLAGGLLK